MKKYFVPCRYRSMAFILSEDQNHFKVFVECLKLEVKLDSEVWHLSLITKYRAYLRHYREKKTSVNCLNH